MTETPEEWKARIASIGVLGKHVGKPRVGITRTDKATLIETENWDGSQDATVRPDTVRFKARTHREGRKKGEVADISPMSNKEKRKYGDQK